MHDAGADLLCLAEVPEILPQVSAGPADHIQSGMVFIAALRALPLKIVIDQDLAVIAAACS